MRTPASFASHGQILGMGSAMINAIASSSIAESESLRIVPVPGDRLGHPAGSLLGVCLDGVLPLVRVARCRPRGLRAPGWRITLESTRTIFTAGTPALSSTRTNVMFAAPAACSGTCDPGTTSSLVSFPADRPAFMAGPPIELVSSASTAS